MTATIPKLLLVGAGGFGREVAEAVRSPVLAAPAWELLGFLDDDPAKRGTTVDGVPVLGGVDAAERYPEADLLLCPVRPDSFGTRRLLAGRLGLGDERYATFVHPTATVGPTSSIGAGSVLLAHVDLTAGVRVGRHVAIMPQTVLTHDVVIGDFATLASGVRLGGGCRIAGGAYIGSGACIREGITVGEGALVGMGSVLTRDVPPGRLWFGAPARDISAVSGAPLEAA